MKTKNLIIFGLILFFSILFIFNFKKTKVYKDSKNQPFIGKTPTTTIIVKKQFQPSPLTGIKCENYNTRPYAIFLENDPVARPLSGISSADIVVEMPVFPGITRLLAFYQCSYPKEVGSLRSARDDFIPVAKGFDAILVHFGGSKYALELLEKDVIDNINALFYDGIYFYRKPSLKPPHNSFTNFKLLEKAREKLEYRKELSFTTYEFYKDEKEFLEKEKKDVFQIDIFYGEGYNVSWVYDKDKKKFFRKREEYFEIDKLTKEPVFAKNILVLFTKSKLLDQEYNDVKVIGEGKLYYLTEGELIEGSWYKKDFSSKIKFFDKDGEELKFFPGKIWIEYVDQDTKVSLK